MKKAFLCMLLAGFLVLSTGFSDVSFDRNSHTADVSLLPSKSPETQQQTEQEKPSFIKWIDFNASSTIISKCQKAHQKLIKKGIEDIGTCELLAYLALRNGNSFNARKDSATLSKLMKELDTGHRESIDKYKENKYFQYYVKSYHAILDGIIDTKTGDVIGYFPLAKGYWYSHYDDFGNARNFGFKRRHLGHDMFGGTGTPIIAMEGGTITELGWNRYGGWRVGIRSDDTNRYYYYAHLRRKKPYPSELKLGDRIEAGQVIGYLGNTGYSNKPDTNMKSTKPHLHFGMQIIFDPSQEDGSGEIWIDVYQIVKFLTNRKVETIKSQDEHISKHMADKPATRLDFI